MKHRIEILYTVYVMGSATGGGGQGGHAPHPKNGWGGSNAFGPTPPIFWENSVMKHN